MKNQPNSPGENRNSGNTNNPNRNGGNNKRRFNKPRPPRNFWKSLLTNKAFDLLIIVIGVSLAIFLYNLTVNADVRSTEKFYIENLSKDIDKDLALLSANLKEIQHDNEVVVEYVRQYGQGSAVGDSLASVIVAVLSLDNFDGVNNSYLSLMGSGGLSTIEDPALRMSIADYYNRYGSIARFESTYTTVLFDMNNYFSQYCNYTLRKITDRSVLVREQTKNNLLLIAAQLESGIEAYDEAIARAQALKKDLKSRM